MINHEILELLAKLYIYIYIYADRATVCHFYTTTPTDRLTISKQKQDRTTCQWTYRNGSPRPSKATVKHGSCTAFSARPNTKSKSCARIKPSGLTRRHARSTNTTTTANRSGDPACRDVWVHIRPWRKRWRATCFAGTPLRLTCRFGRE